MESRSEKSPTENQQNPLQKSVAPLTRSFLSIYSPNLKNTKSQLEELTEKQSSLVDQIHEENLKTAEIQHSKDLQDIFSKIEVYQVKLINIKKNMKHLHEKSLKLKKRGLKLQQIKNKQDYLKQKKETDLKLEEELIGK